MEYNERIKQYRMQKNITQQQLADAVGVSRQSVVRWENGFTVPSMYYAQKLAEYFGITVTELMTGATESASKNLERDTRVQYSHAIIRFCLAVFLIVVIYSLVYDLMSTLRYYCIQTNDSTIVISSTFKMAFSVTDGLVVAAMAAALARWIMRLVAWLGVTDDRYMWHTIYKKWTIGLAAWLINILTVVFIIYVNVMSVVFLYVMAAVVAIPVYYLIDFVIKKAIGQRMVVAGNKTLDIINLVYCAVVTCGVVALLAWIVYAVTKFRPAYGLEVAFAILFFCIAAIVILISYIIVRVSLHVVYARRNRNEQ